MVPLFLLLRPADAVEKGEDFPHRLLGIPSRRVAAEVELVAGFRELGQLDLRTAEIASLCDERLGGVDRHDGGERTVKDQGWRQGAL